MIETYSSPADLAREAADAVLAGLAAGLSARGRASLVATGGRSPAPVYDRLALSLLDWSKVEVTLSDERFVPPDDPASNERLVRERLLTAKAASARFIPLYRPAADAEAAARAAEADVRAVAPFDVVMLGMGEDGHIASLIPGDPNLADAMDPASGAVLRGVPAGLGSPPVPRITLTLPALLQARLTLVLISGEAKRAVVAEGRGLPVHALLEQVKAPVRVLWTP